MLSDNRLPMGDVTNFELRPGVISRKDISANLSLIQVIKVVNIDVDRCSQTAAIGQERSLNPVQPMLGSD